MGDKGFFGCLFDLSFSDFVTTRFVKILYVLGILGAVLGGLGVLRGGFAVGGFSGVVGGLILSPIAFLLYVLAVRISLELLVVIFRIAENTSRLVEQGKTNSPESL